MAKNYNSFEGWAKKFDELWKARKFDEALALRKEVWDTWLKEGNYTTLPPDEQKKWKDPMVCLPDGTIADDPRLDPDKLWKRRLGRMYADLRKPVRKPKKGKVRKPPKVAVARSIEAPKPKM